MAKVKDLGIVDYSDSFQAMKEFTTLRTVETEDEIWMLEHRPVFTQGRSGKAEHILNAQGILVVQSDRGGQVTYHGPGQLVAYLLYDLNKSGLSVRCFVHAVEEAVIATLSYFNVNGQRLEGSPGVYVEGKKIASIGLKVSKGLTYHGLSFNAAMDLQPFSLINPCGMPGLLVTQLREFVGVHISDEDLLRQLKKMLAQNLLLYLSVKTGSDLGCNGGVVFNERFIYS